MNLRMILLFLVSLLQIACATGNNSYIGPPTLTDTRNKYERVYNGTIDQVWDATINYCSNSFFVMDQIIKDSRIINISFSVSDPSEYINCGTFSSWIQNARGRRDYNISPAQQYAKYEILQDGKLFFIERTATLEGKINIYLSDAGNQTTKVRVKARYILSKRGSVYDPLGKLVKNLDSINSFSTSERGQAGGESCQPTYKLESNILDGIQSNLNL